MATIQVRTEWKDVAVPMRELRRALEDNKFADAIIAYNRLELLLERWKADMNTIVDKIQELLNG